MSPVPQYEVETHRYGALGIKELETGVVAVTREDVEASLELNLNTLCPGDRLVLVVIRR